MSVSPSPEDNSVTSPQGIPGIYVIAGMFAFGALLTGLLYTYWQFHTAPFQELQTALADEFPGCRPRVEGGQRKQHKDTPMVLRMVLKVDFHPSENPEMSEKMADQVIKLAHAHHPMEPYDLAEIHLYWPEEEQEIHEHVIERELKPAS